MKNLFITLFLILFCSVIIAQPTENAKWATDSLNIEGLGIMSDFGIIRSVFVNDTIAYVCADNSLLVVDICNKSNPSLLGSFETEDNTMDVYVSNDYAFVANNEGGLRIIDVYWPDSPYEIGFYDSDGYSYGVFVNGQYAYVADGTEGMRIIDVSNPTAPVEAGYYNTNGYSRAVYVEGNYAYIADGTAGLIIVDISNVASPSFVGSIFTEGDFYDVVVKDNIAYVVADYYGLRVIDVSYPAAPSEINYYYTPGYADYLQVLDNHVFVSDYSAGLVVLNINDFDDMYEEAYYQIPGNAFGLSVSDQLYEDGTWIYMADFTKGMYILKATDLVSGQDTPELSSNSTELTYNAQNSTLTITSTEEKGRLVVFDASGKAVLTKNIQGTGSHEMYFDANSAGLYLAVFKSATNESKLKFVYGK
ncbi:MAG: T9SS type A sorting domain-containing protein [Bacteroidales bacterium]|nr:T9SS type A sorting domain-containing protein [Bacteroidales bacterium]